MLLKPDLLLTEEAPTRRGFIGGLRNLALAASGAAATHRLILPNETSPEERARRAWAEFSSAMREMTTDAHGWRIIVAGETKPFRHLPAQSMLAIRSVHFTAGTEPRLPDYIVETWRDFSL